MGGMFGGQNVRSVQEANLPNELKPLASESAWGITNFQRLMPLSGFAGPNARQVAGLTPGQLQARTLANTLNATPQAERQAASFATNAAGVAGNAARGYNTLNIAGQPAGERQAASLFNSTIPRAGMVTPQFQQVAKQAQGLFPYASQMSGAYNNAGQQAQAMIPVARQTPEQYAQQTAAAQGLMGIAERMPQGIGDLVSMSGDPRTQEAIGALRNQSVQDFANIGRGDISQSPTILAAQKAFEENILPQIQNQAALGGLGRSTALSRGMGAANAQALLPLIQEEFARQERGVNLATELGLQQAMAGERGLERELGARQFGVEQERAGIERQLQTGQFGVQTGLEEAAARERAIGRELEARGLGVQTTLARGAAEDQARERGVAAKQAALDYGLQSALASERGTERDVAARQAAAQGFFNIGQADTARRMEVAAAQERAAQNQATAMLQGSGLLTNLGAAQTNRLLQNINLRNTLGQEEQAVQQARYDAQLDDYLRRQALSETALFQPFGQIAPSTVGQNAVQNQRGLLK